MITIQFANGRTKTVSERRVLLTITLFFLVFLTLVMIPPRCPPARRESSRTVAALRPTMERIANHGGAAADMWLAWHYRELSRVPSAAAAGYPPAQYLQGLLLIHGGHHHAGERLLRRAAAAGYPCAVAREDLHLKNLDSFSCW